MENKRFYWIKLYTNFFNEDSFKFLMSQENGSQYITLYLMLCLMSANTDGRLCMNIGQMIVPYDIDKITLECKYYSRDTVTIALRLYQRMGLIYEQSDGVLAISGFDDLVGSETASARRMRTSRKKGLTEPPPSDIPEVEADETEAPPDNKPKRKRKAFQKPTIEEVKTYCQEKGYCVDPDKWYSHYESNGWLVGKNPMKDWKASVRYWDANNRKNGQQNIPAFHPATSKGGNSDNSSFNNLAALNQLYRSEGIDTTRND